MSLSKTHAAVLREAHGGQDGHPFYGNQWTDGGGGGGDNGGGKNGDGDDREAKITSISADAAASSLFDSDQRTDAKDREIADHNVEWTTESSNGTADADTAKEPRAFDPANPDKGYTGQTSKARMKLEYDGLKEAGWKPAKPQGNNVILKSPNGKHQVRFMPIGKTKVRQYFEPAGHGAGKMFVGTKEKKGEKSGVVLDLEHAAALSSAAEMLCGGYAEPYPMVREARSYSEVIAERKEREWPYVRRSALTEAINSTLEDPTLDDDEKADKVRESVAAFLAEEGEMSARMATEQQAQSLEAKQASVRAALERRLGPQYLPGVPPWYVKDTFEDKVVVDRNGKLVEYGLFSENGMVVIGEPRAVEVEYVATTGVAD